MNEKVKDLIYYLCNDKLKYARMSAEVLLKADNTEKDKRFCAEMLEKLNKINNSKFIIPEMLKSLLVGEPYEDYIDAKYMVRDYENKKAVKVLNTYKAAEKLAEKHIKYNAALLLHGESGCGKTELARYIAYKAKLPFIYVRYSQLVGSYLGETQKNVQKVFDYVKTVPCVLCFDEIDVVGMARGKNKNDVGEMDRIVVTLMQELDNLPNNVILIGTTNRYDDLDTALVSRFPMRLEVKRLSAEEIKRLVTKYFAYAGYTVENIDEWLVQQCLLAENTARNVIRLCTEYVVERIVCENNAEGVD